MSPTVIYPASSQPDTQSILLTERTKSLALFLVLNIIIVAITKLVETNAVLFALQVMFDALQATKQQCLTHAVQISTQRIHQHHTMCLRIGSQLRVVSGASQGIIQNLIETCATKLLRNQVLHFPTTISRCLVAQVRLHLIAELHIVIAIDTEDILNDIHITLHINTIDWHIQS